MTDITDIIRPIVEYMVEEHFYLSLFLFVNLIIYNVYVSIKRIRHLSIKIYHYIIYINNRYKLW